LIEVSSKLFEVFFRFEFHVTLPKANSRLATYTSISFNIFGHKRTLLSIFSFGNGSYIGYIIFIGNNIFIGNGIFIVLLFQQSASRWIGSGQQSR